MAHADKPADTRAPNSIEAEMEATRARLAGTIDQLVYRASPKTIARREVAGVKAHFVDVQGKVRTGNVFKVAGIAAGVVAMIVVLRKATR